QRGRVAHVDLVLRGPDLVMDVLDRDPDRLERAHRLLAQLAGGVHRRHREVAALVQRLGALVVLEEEVLELRADVEGVEAHALHERGHDLARRDGKALQVPLDVREPEKQELDPLLLDPAQHALARLRIARRPRLALDLRHASSLQTQKPRTPSAPEAPSPHELRQSTTGAGSSSKLSSRPWWAIARAYSASAGAIASAPTPSAARM